MKLTMLAVAFAATISISAPDAQAREFHHHYGHRGVTGRHSYHQYASRHYPRFSSRMRRHAAFRSAAARSGYGRHQRTRQFAAWIHQRAEFDYRGRYTARRVYLRRDVELSSRWAGRRRTAYRGGSRRVAYRGGYGGRPAAWCGWEMRRLVGADPGPSYNLARNWSHWGHSGPVGIGAVVVWPHHVGKIVGKEGGQWVVESGNDGHRLRTRPRSLAGAIAFRWG